MIAPLTAFHRKDGILEVVEVLGNDSLSGRLRELGFGAGRTLSVIKVGAPSIIDLGGPRFALAGELLERVLVRPAGH